MYRLATRKDEKASSVTCSYSNDTVRQPDSWIDMNAGRMNAAGRVGNSSTTLLKNIRCTYLLQNNRQQEREKVRAKEQRLGDGRRERRVQFVLVYQFTFLMPPPLYSNLGPPTDSHTFSSSCAPAFDINRTLGIIIPPYRKSSFVSIPGCQQMLQLTSQSRLYVMPFYGSCGTYGQQAVYICWVTLARI